MLAFGAAVGRRRQYPQWFAAKLRMEFAVGGPVGMRYISTSRDRAAARIASPTVPNGRMGILVRSLQLRPHNSNKGSSGLHEIHRTHVHTLVACSNAGGANGSPSLSIGPMEVDCIGEP